MLPFRYLAVFALVAVTFAQDYDYDSPPRARPAPARVNPSYSGPTAPKPTPVPILKQINRHNEDGSYTYGYEGADGSFKIETKLPTGEVKGKYGYVDDTGKVRVVEYGATKYGFEPAGEGITVAPPTLVDETTNKDGTLNQEYAGYEQQQVIPAPIVRQHQQAPIRPRPRPQAYSPPQQFEPVPQDDAPVPPRAVIPGSQPVQTQTFDFGPSVNSRPRPAAPARSFTPAARPPPVQYARPAPIDDYDEPSPRQQARPAPPKITYAQPAPLGPPAGRSSPPQYAPRPSASQYVPRPASPRGGGGILDQLQQDYALPANGAAPLHDISFGYY